MGRCLDILEVSQKQAFIFKSNKLKDNIYNSNLIAWITSPEYFEQAAGDLFVASENLVYSGGGHIILEFADVDVAKRFNKRITGKVYEEHPDIELFVTTWEYNDELRPGENIEELTKKLERKKAERRASFHQGTFGVEKIDNTTLEAVLHGKEKKDDAAVGDGEAYFQPQGFRFPDKFEELGGAKGESNFVAIIHIDGNGMGKRVANFNEANKELSWQEFKARIRDFSEGIAEDFKAAFKELACQVATSCPEEIEEGLNQGNLPLRRIITSGDDICFVTEGRIGLECARIYIESLGKKKNQVDGEGYAACAGVAIVHQKYPFFRAYELAEALCSNAKRFCASIDEDNNGAAISAVDWHISFGELEDHLEFIRSDYLTGTGKRLELRPYIIAGPKELIEKEPLRRYESFKAIMEILQREDSYARGAVKQLRAELKKGEKATVRYVKFHKLDQLIRESSNTLLHKSDIDKIGKGRNPDGEDLEGQIFVKTYDEMERSVLFDAIELMDCYLNIVE